MMHGHLCTECKFYRKPSGWERIKWHQFAERCLHPRQREPVDGEPTPCITARINDCDGTEKTLFRPLP
jgi:hypothetical protein